MRLLMRALGGRYLTHIVVKERRECEVGARSVGLLRKRGGDLIRLGLRNGAVTVA